MPEPHPDTMRMHNSPQKGPIEIAKLAVQRWRKR